MVLQTVSENDSEILKFMLVAEELKDARELIEKLEQFESICKNLQNANTNLAETRTLFDYLIQKFPSTKNALSAENN